MSDDRELETAEEVYAEIDRLDSLLADALEMNGLLQQDKSALRAELSAALAALRQMRGVIEDMGSPYETWEADMLAAIDAVLQQKGDGDE